MAKLPGPAELLPIPRSAAGVTRQPRDFASEALSGFGSSMFSAGAELKDAFDKEKKRVDNSRVEDAFNELRKSQLDLTIGQENGFSNIKSGDAVKRPILKEWTEKLMLSRDDILRRLDNEEQKTAFNKRFDVTLTQYQQDILQHGQRENQAYQKQNLDSTLSVERDLSTLHWNSPADVMASLERVKSAVNTFAQANGYDEQTTKATYVQAASNVHSAIIEQAISSGNPDYAELWMKTHKDEISAPVAKSLEKTISISRQTKLAQSVADEVQTQGLTEQQALDQVRKKYEGTDRREIEQEIKARYAEDQRLKKDDQDNAASDAYRLISQGSKFSEIPANIINRMDGRAIESLRVHALNRATGFREKTDPKAYYELINMTTEDTAKFVDTNLLEYRDKLSEGDWEKIVTMQQSLKAGDAKSQEKIQVLQRAMSYSKGLLKATGIDVNPKPGTSQAERLARYQSALEEELGSIYETKKRKPTSDEISQVVGILLTKGYIRDFGFDTETPLFDIPAGEEANFYIQSYGDIPKEDRKKVEDSLRNDGILITKKNVEDRYTRLILMGRQRGTAR